jgi:hypothetical protein
MPCNTLAIRIIDSDASSDFAECRGLFVGSNLETARNQR